MFSFRNFLLMLIFNTPSSKARISQSYHISEAKLGWRWPAFGWETSNNTLTRRQAKAIANQTSLALKMQQGCCKSTTAWWHFPPPTKSHWILAYALKQTVVIFLFSRLSILLGGISRPSSDSSHICLFGNSETAHPPLLAVPLSLFAEHEDEGLRR